MNNVDNLTLSINKLTREVSEPFYRQREWLASRGTYLERQCSRKRALLRSTGPTTAAREVLM